LTNETVFSPKKETNHRLNCLIRWCDQGRSHLKKN